ncbi:MAG: UPF0149 family protein [Polaromonas sp.]|nr:UPF0149 family protein [Polaromonas sp.]
MPPSSPPAAPANPPALAIDDLNELDTILDELRSRDDETPQWEFCDGFMAALICSRRPIDEAEYLPVLLGAPDEPAPAGLEPDAIAPDAQPLSSAAPFGSVNQQARFVRLWRRRWNEVRDALDADVESHEDERCYAPEVLDMRSMVAEMAAEERADFERELGSDTLPAFAQVWALGFMYAVENWPEEWVPPRDREATEALNAALIAIVALTEDDDSEAEVSPFVEDGPPSVSRARLNAFGDAIWAVYELRDVWRSIGPRVETVRKPAAPGRNDPCPCGSGKKYKKCHGAG